MNTFFEKAIPVWEKNKEIEKNYHLSFGTSIPKSSNCKLHISGSSMYNIYIDGEFIATGPARAAHSFYRVDEIDISKYLKNETSILTIDVAGYNINSYYLLDQPAFLCAEIFADNETILATGNNSDFVAIKRKGIVQKVQRYSFQRPFVEVYSLDNSYNDFSSSLQGDYVELIETEPKEFLPRNIFYPDYKVVSPKKAMLKGTFSLSEKEEYKFDRSVTRISDTLKGYITDELQFFSSKEMQKLDFAEGINIEERETTYYIEEKNYITFEMPNEVTGTILLNISCKEDCTIYLTFDELLTDNKLNFARMQCCNVIVWHLKKGEYKLHTNEPYSFKYLQVNAVEGSFTFSNLKVRTYCHPETNKKLKSNDEKLKKIYNAALQSFKQNTFDIFMDCPSRERAGWLCDSFFTSRVEHTLTGKNIVEKNFLENFILPEKFEHLPEGMLPMCYPADHNDGTFVPNWAMWFVLELREYEKRTKDADFIAKCKDKVYALLNYFEKFVNEYGLLEDLENWVFIEWSFANDLTWGINFPTNMLFSSMLSCMGELYNDEKLLLRSKKIKETICEMSYRDGFFHDNAYRENGEIVLNHEITEVCQYYAFFTETASPKTHPDLWKTLLEDFGPDRKENNKWKEIHFANAFIGNYLRLELLLINGEKEKLLENILGYFYYMAERTGTLWELIDEKASCNHGFASYVIYWLDKLELLY